MTFCSSFQKVYLRETLVKKEAGNAQLLTGLRKSLFSRDLSPFWTRHQNEKLQKISSFIRVFLLFSQLPQKTPFKCTLLLQQFLWRSKAILFARETAGRVLCTKRPQFMSYISPSAFKDWTFIHAETGNGGLKLSNSANGQMKLLHFATKWCLKIKECERFTLQNILKQ